MILDWQPLRLTLELAAVTTGLLLAVGIPLSWWLAHGRGGRLRPVVESLVGLPLVLPPTVLGFYLLLVFSPVSWLGGVLTSWGVHLAFSFAGLVIGSVLFSLPFMVQPLLAGFRQIPVVWLEAGRTLGKNEATLLWRVALPNNRGGVLSGVILTFAHTVGEFGVVLMVGGNIPGETRVVSIALFHEVEAMNYAAAHGYAAILVGFSFLVLLGLRWLQRPRGGG